MTIRRGFTRALLALAAASVLTACGGGGGGGGSAGGGGGTDPSTAPGLTLSRTSVALQAMMTLPAAPQDIVVTVTSSEVAGVVAGYAPGVTPPTLAVGQRNWQRHDLHAAPDAEHRLARSRQLQHVAARGGGTC